MKNKYIFSRFQLSDITALRAYNAVSFRLLEIPHEMAWVFGKKAHENRQKLAKFQNIHKGERCFIIGNGPSLSKMDLSILKNEITFGLNRIYLLFDQLNFLPTYYVSANGLVLSQFHSEIQQLPMPKFINWSLRKYFMQPENEDINYFRLSLNPIMKFQSSLISRMNVGGTVTYIAMQIAFFMGFKEVILIGVDHSFTAQGTPNTVEKIKTEQDLNHFSPDYFPKGIKWQLPDLLNSEHAYRLARTNFENAGRKIIDATVNGQCQVFEKVNFNDLF